jgi:hypothetical protein
VEYLRARAAEAGDGRAFEGLLMCAGYLDEHASHYGRRLIAAVARVLLVDADFPCLRRANLPDAVRKAIYHLDLDAVDVPEVDPDAMLQELGY